MKIILISKKILCFFEIVNCHQLIINPTPICRRSLTDGILGSATVACGNIGSTTLKEQGQIIHQGRRPCFATRRWPIPKMEIVQRFSFLVSDKKEIVQLFFFVMSNALNCATIFLVMSNALKEIVQRFFL